VYIDGSNIMAMNFAYRIAQTIFYKHYSVHIYNIYEHYIALKKSEIAIGFISGVSSDPNSRKVL
jgi:hypothetical protein